MIGARSDQEEQMRKATGSSRHNRSSPLQPHSRMEPLQASVSLTCTDSDSEDESEISQRHTHRRKSSTSASSAQRQGERHETPQYAMAEHSNTLETSNDWDIIERPTPRPAFTTDTPTFPSYNFPGTWSAAYHDTSTALARVGIASKSYASALTQSGIGKAGWSIGSAFLVSTGTGASNLTGWALNQAGVVPNDLPRPLRGWLEGKSRKYEALIRRGSQTHEPGAEQPGPFLLEDEHEGFMIDGYQLGAASDVPRTRPMDMDARNSREHRGWQRAPMSYSPPPPHLLAQIEDALQQTSDGVEKARDHEQEEDRNDEEWHGIFEIEDDE